MMDAAAAFPDEANTPLFNNELSIQGLATYQLTFENMELLAEIDAVIECNYD